MSRYTSATEDDRRAMLDAIGVGSVEELFADIPENVRFREDLDIPAGLSETEVFDHLRELAAKNVSADEEVSFLGAGMYDHYVPGLVEHVIERSEFLTPYTPYQPEVSQGNLQAMFEYQTAISELTALPVSNASVYEAPSAVGAAGYLAKLTNGRPRFVVSRGVHPHSRETLRTMSVGYGTSVDEVPLSGGVTDPDEWARALDSDVAAVVIQQPNFLGAIEDVEALAAAAKEHGAIVICQADALTLGILKPPGQCGVDLCVGEGQPLGNRLDFGWPSFGFFTAGQDYLRKMPGRIAGETTDADGKRGFVLTLQTREQHIRREKATSNICTAQQLNALAGVIYLSWLGRHGIVELGHLMLQRTAYARERLAAVDGIELLHDEPVIREFAITLDAPVDAVIAACAAEGIHPGYGIRADYPEHPNGLLVAITERRTKEQIDRLADVLARAVAEHRSASETREPAEVAS
jgi:glycine dehydrogenase subunit 1